MLKQRITITLLLFLVIGLSYVKIQNVYKQEHSVQEAAIIEQKNVSKNIKQQQIKEKNIDKEIANVQKSIQTIIEGTEGSLSVSYYDTNLQKGFSVQGDDNYEGEFLLNVPVSLLLDNAGQEKLSNKLLSKVDDKTLDEAVQKLGGLQRVMQSLADNYQGQIVTNKDNTIYMSTNQMMCFAVQIATNENNSNILNQMKQDKLIQSDEYTEAVYLFSSDHHKMMTILLDINNLTVNPDAIVDKLAKTI